MIDEADRHGAQPGLAMARPTARARPRATTLWLAIAAAAALAVSLFVAPEALPGLGSCPFRTATGIPCPGCGLTRSFCAISHGRFLEAWQFNPFGFPFYAVAAALVVREAAAHLLPRRQGRPGPAPRRGVRPATRGVLPATLFAVAVMYAFTIARALGAFTPP